MMNSFFDKWKDDKKYQAKIKLILYIALIALVSLYALSYNGKNQNLENSSPSDINTDITGTIIKIPDEYTYTISITINDAWYKYSGTKNKNKETIIKETSNETNEYVYQNGEYYVKQGDIFIKTTKSDVYDVIKYNYIDLKSIEVYLNKAEKKDNQYYVYLKDIILGNDSNEYFIITIIDDKIIADYTQLIREFDPSIEKYQVEISIKEME